MLMGKILGSLYQLLRILLQLSLLRALFIWCLKNMSELIPVDKISETDTLICFYHPQPAYPLHILLLPKEDIRDLSRLDPAEGEFFADLIKTVNELVEQLDLEKPGYRLIVNGGKYQEFPQLHFHLVSG